jgi:uncharacterized BrkB/YihY/UPF0761 family membrane protein
MIRKFLTIVLPLLLPFLIYGLYLVLAQRKARLAGAGKLPRWQDAPWTWILIAGAVLLAVTLIAFRLTEGVAPGTKVEPPRFEYESKPGLPVE